MNKISYKHLTVEITRICNMDCAHCFRGDAQNKDMSYEVIDAFVSKTDIIYQLSFTGGEPTINLDGMRYFLESCKKYKVVILGLSYVTNATIRNKELVQLIKDCAEYIGSYITVEPKIAISIGVSTDIFHGEDSKAGYKWYRENLSNHATITQHRAGDVPYNFGRAKELGYANIFVKEPQAVQIHYKTNEHDPLCMEKNYFPLMYPEQVIILCHLYLAVDGSMLDSHVGMMDYNRIDSTIPIWDICSVQESGDILDAIKEYNINKPHCSFENANKPTSGKNKISLYGETMIHAWLMSFGVNIDTNSAVFNILIMLYNALKRHPDPINYVKDLIAYFSHTMTYEGNNQEAVELVTLIKTFVGIHAENDDSLEDYIKRWNTIKNIDIIKNESVPKAITEKAKEQKLSLGEKAEIINTAKKDYLHRKHGYFAKNIEENYSEQDLLEYFEIAKNIDDIMAKIQLADSVESIEQLETMLEEAQQREREFLISHNVG